jgi:hypothetical protein
MALNREELAWAAGFFDGEGSTSLYFSHGHPYLRLSIPQTDERLLIRFQAAVGGLGIVGPPRRPKGYKAHWKTIWKYSVRKQADVYTILDLLWPYLSEPKKDQALLCDSRVKAVS